MHFTNMMFTLQLFMLIFAFFFFATKLEKTTFVIFAIFLNLQTTITLYINIKNNYRLQFFIFIP